MHIFGTNTVLDDIRSPTYSTTSTKQKTRDKQTLSHFSSMLVFLSLPYCSSCLATPLPKKGCVIFFHIARLLFNFTCQANWSAISGLSLPGLPLCRRSPQVYVGDGVHLWQTEQKQAACGHLNSSFVKSPVNQTIVYCEKTIGQRRFVECLPGSELIIIPGITQMSG